MPSTPDPAAPTGPMSSDTALATDRGRLDDLLSRWAAERHAGYEPTPEDLCGDDPPLCEALGYRIRAEKLLEWRRAPDATVSLAGRPLGDTPPGDLPEVPGFSVVRELGTGGMGVVYEAVQHGLNRPVAIKMLLTDRRTGDAAAVRFLAEAEAVAAVRHPHVVQVYEFGRTSGRPFLAMELCPRSLKDRLKADGPLPHREAARLVAKVALGVQAAHAQQIVHRDLKPGNVLLTAAGEPMVSDFGLAKRGAGSDLTRTHAVMGTPDYMAPEQAEGRAKFVGPAADVWALGVILYECLTGARPFAADGPVAVARRVLDATPTRPRALDRNVPRDLERVCLKCLEKDPAKRYPSAAALAADLDNYLDGRPVAARPRSAADRAWGYCAARPLEVCLALLLGLLFVRFVVGNAEALFGLGLPAEANLDLRTAMNLTLLGGIAGAVVGVGFAAAQWARGRRPAVFPQAARGAIAGLAVMAAAAFVLPTLGTSASNTFSNVQTRMPGEAGATFAPVPGAAGEPQSAQPGGTFGKVASKVGPPKGP